MTQISLEVTLRNAEARSALEEVLARMSTRRPFFAQLGERLLTSTKDRFAEETAPDGSAWTPLKRATIRSRERKGQTPITILRSNSRGKSGSSLAGSLSYAASEEALRLGSPLPYAGIHQTGGTINKPARQGQIYRARHANGTIGRRFVAKSKADVVTDVSIPAHTIAIPARPYLGLSLEDEAAVLEEAEDWLLR